LCIPPGHACGDRRGAGNFRLRDIENFLEMADAKRSTCKQMGDPEPRGVAEASVNLNQFHGQKYGVPSYICQ
jgi:hypothetical protein